VIICGAAAETGTQAGNVIVANLMERRRDILSKSCDRVNVEKKT
jgi:hypothetical protein